MIKRREFVYLFIILFIIIGFRTTNGEVINMNGFQITSPVFENNGFIPTKYTCDGEDINPQLLIANVPAGTKSLALIVDDPDAPAGTWVHWVVWNIDPQAREIKKNSVPTGANQGLNDFRKHKYGGPCPPSGTHRYFFKLYALDTMLTLDFNATRAHVEKAMREHIIAETRIVGLYKRS
ncbi:MAG: YbhB/YbcL family Raf kinase inhibitor-like protein [Dissulfurispiraceae bacterium]